MIFSSKISRTWTAGLATVFHILPQIYTVIAYICIGKVAWFPVYVFGNLWNTVAKPTVHVLEIFEKNILIKWTNQMNEDFDFYFLLDFFFILPFTHYSFVNVTSYLCEGKETTEWTRKVYYVPWSIYLKWNKCITWTVLPNVINIIRISYEWLPRSSYPFYIVS